ncbi:MAG: hypothetical protein CVT92_10960 [Bacteroidetes bacterium HGW-Bacteroidetes-1]|jgi:type IV secretory pathway VirB10-like protein|nr:MAG: hypothetical protein CVT92_10960 [Bacteroidetes bacterium HGW-Bacteroidetes-1]
MKRNILIIAAFVLFTTISCSSEQKESKQTQNERQNAVQTSNTQKIATDTSLAVQPDANENVELNGEIIAPTIARSETAPRISNAPILNPPHGQPGHRCEIPVGSPLNSTPSTNTPKANASSPVPRVNNNATSPIVTSETPALNPPHGQPGHRCEIPVGSPLK